MIYAYCQTGSVSLETRKSKWNHNTPQNFHVDQESITDSWCARFTCQLSLLFRILAYVCSFMSMVISFYMLPVRCDSVLICTEVLVVVAFKSRQVSSGWLRTRGSQKLLGIPMETSFFYKILDDLVGSVKFMRCQRTMSLILRLSLRTRYDEYYFFRVVSNQKGFHSYR